jgi:hypothetical protein
LRDNFAKRHELPQTARYGPHRKMLVARFAMLSLCGFPEHDRGINFPKRRRIKAACKSIGRSVAKTMQASLSKKECAR